MGASGQAQSVSREEAWKHVVEQDGMTIKYIVYDQADGRSYGVVLLLQNANSYSIRYRFSVVFRAPESETVRAAEGILLPGEAKTGDHDGLFWIPFGDSRPIIEIGIRGLVVSPAYSPNGYLNKRSSCAFPRRM